MSNLLEAATDYERVELTMLVLQKKGSGYFNLFTNIELVPSEQMRSESIGTESKPFERIGVNAEYTLYIGRTFSYTVPEAIELFSKSAGGFIFKFPGGSEQINLFPKVELLDEPPNNYPILVNDSDNKSINAILPYRHTTFRVWLKLDKQKDWLRNIEPKLQKRLLDKMTVLTTKYLNFDITKTQEHLGNIYLSGCNPLLRRFDMSLLDSNSKLLVDFKEREGKTIVGCKLVFEELRGDHTGFTVSTTVDSCLQVIDLPYFPDQLITRLYDKEGTLLDKHSGVWVNIAAALNLIETHVNLTVKKDDEIEHIKIPKYEKAQKVNVGKYDHSNAQYFQVATRSRKFLQLEESKEFIFFPGNLADKRRAQSCIREIVERASERCIFLDPYFGAGDIIYAIVVQNVGFPVQILSSANFLRRKINSATDPITQAERLLDTLNEYAKIYPRQDIQCRVLLGNKRSPLHDRYLVADDKVYLLGSSFNEFGSRATTLAKVPTPDRMVSQAIIWWNDNKTTSSLFDFVELIKLQRSAPR